MDNDAAAVINQIPLILIIGSGLMMIIGFRHLAGVFFISALAILFGLPFLSSALGENGMALLALAVAVFILLTVLRSAAALFLGEGAANSMTGALAADIVRFCVAAPVAIIRKVLGR